ncbi:hypothetical protein [Bradyrhizobium sp. USDA 3650]
MSGNHSERSTVVLAADEDAAENIADALTYLSRAATDAGYEAIAADILLVREKLMMISNAEKAPIPRRTHA